MGRRTIFRSLLILTALCCTGVIIIVTVPAFKEKARIEWHRLKCPEIPEQRSSSTVGADGMASYFDPWPFSPASPSGPNLHYDFEDSLSTFAVFSDDAFAGRQIMRVIGEYSQAIVRRAGDVADSLISISAGFNMKCTEQVADVRIIIRIDHPDGSLVEWNEKRLRPEEHRPGEWERFNFEWLLRDLSVAADDRVAIFIRNPDGAEVAIDELDIVFRSAQPLKPRPRNA